MKNLIGRTSVPKEPQNDVHACEDFLNVIVNGHVAAASKKIQQFHQCNEVDDPSEKYSLFIEGVKELVKIMFMGFYYLIIVRRVKARFRHMANMYLHVDSFSRNLLMG